MSHSVRRVFVPPQSPEMMRSPLWRQQTSEFSCAIVKEREREQVGEMSDQTGGGHKVENRWDVRHLRMGRKKDWISLVKAVVDFTLKRVSGWVGSRANHK